jgi:hypothetical protein
VREACHMRATHRGSYEASGASPSKQHRMYPRTRARRAADVVDEEAVLALRHLRVAMQVHGWEIVAMVGG